MKEFSRQIKNFCADCGIEIAIHNYNENTCPFCIKIKEGEKNVKLKNMES